MRCQLSHPPFSFRLWKSRQPYEGGGVKDRYLRLCIHIIHMYITKEISYPNMYIYIYTQTKS